jgi:hypothetical protein
MLVNMMFCNILLWEVHFLLLVGEHVAETLSLICFTKLIVSSSVKDVILYCGYRARGHILIQLKILQSDSSNPAQ